MWWWHTGCGIHEQIVQHANYYCMAGVTGERQGRGSPIIGYHLLGKKNIQHFNTNFDSELLLQCKIYAKSHISCFSMSVTFVIQI